MTLEEIKKWRTEEECKMLRGALEDLIVYTKAISKRAGVRISDPNTGAIDHAESILKETQGTELSWYAKGQQDAAKRCAEIADECKYSFNSPSQGEDACLDVFEAINKEFGV